MADVGHQGRQARLAGAPAVTPSSRLESIYPRNQHYGTGIYRRRVRLSLAPQRATAVVNDDFHAMWLRLFHDGTTIRDVESGMQRWPKTTCPGAIAVVREVIGLPLAVARRDFYGGGRAGRNCTHLIDLAFWATRQVLRGDGETVVDIAIPDPVRGEGRMQATVDGRIAHDWRVRDAVIQAPAELAGLGVFTGFAVKAEGLLSGLALETAWMLQKAAFVAQGRAYVVDGLPRRSARDEPHRAGACFAFTEPSRSVAMSNVGFVEDFTGGLRELLPPAGVDPDSP
jgi:hypothetical protein